MSLHDAILGLTLFNTLTSGATDGINYYNENKDLTGALSTGLFSTSNATLRTCVAENIYQKTGGERFGGSYIGYLANATAGSDNDKAWNNLLGASLLTNPWIGGGFTTGYATCCLPIMTTGIFLASPPRKHHPAPEPHPHRRHFYC